MAHQPQARRAHLAIRGTEGAAAAAETGPAMAERGVVRSAASAMAEPVWAYDFVEDRTRDGRKFRTLNVVDEFTREALAIRVARKLKAADVIDVLADLFIMRGTPSHIRSDNGPEFAATAVKEWITGVGAKTAYIEPGSPWENGYVESFNGKFRDELLACEVFNTLAEAKILIEQWRVHYNTIRPHSSLGYRAPAPETIISPMWRRPIGVPPTGSAANAVN
jgi:putative transposase